jgi:hypothetical protein
MQIEYIYAFSESWVNGCWLLVICCWLFSRFLELAFLLVGDNLNSLDISLLASSLCGWL